MKTPKLPKLTSDSNTSLNLPQLSHEQKWDIEVSPLINSTQWLKTHGLKRNRLSMQQILSQIGFKRSSDFVGSLEKSITSSYGETLFKRFKNKNGNTYNITVGKRILHQLRENLLRAESLYEQRLKWLTSGSRNIFGVIEERSVSIVLHSSTDSQTDFNLYIQCLCSVIKEQISLLARFNLFSAQDSVKSWQEELRSAPVTTESINDAVAWALELQKNEHNSETCCIDAVMTAMKDNTVDAVYLFAEGDSIEKYKEIFRHKICGLSTPLHIVSFNASKTSTIKYMKELAEETKGRFHAFATKHECEKAVPLAITFGDISDPDNSLASSPLVGGVPAGAGVRDDVFKVWKENEDCRRNLKEIEQIIADVPSLKSEQCVIETPNPENRQEHLLSSKEWLKRNGLKKLGLTAYQILAANSFRHVDGVVDVKTKSSKQNVSDAENLRKLINAKYCDKFAHAQWKDGTVVHVHVTAEQHRNYERRMKIALDKIKRRIHWLQQGSREVFGTVLEEHVYILLDTSRSMKDKLPVLKEKVFQLLQEQIRHKRKFNIVKFDTRAVAWNDKLTDVTEDSLIDAWHWVKDIEAGGSTNTLAALRIALQDINTHAVYLLTDGRPDQPDHVLWSCMLERTQKILEEVNFRQQFPIHTIAFNCNDVEACRFLHQLSSDTGGRYHNFNCNPNLCEVIQPYESEDLALLKQELERGEFDLEKVSQLRTRCVTLDWYHNKQQHNLTPRFGENTSIVPLSSKAKQHLTMDDFDKRPAKYSSVSLESMRPNTSHQGFDNRSLDGSITPSQLHRNHRSMATNDKEEKNPSAAAHHTRTSILRFKATRTRDLDGWILPETRKMLESQLRKSAEACYDIRRIEFQKKIFKKKMKQKRTNPLDLSNAAWLKTNSLSARKLTVMDALAPTAVKFAPKYVPVLDNYVASKVFDDILPIAHLSTSKNRSMKLVNPNAVNLDAYKNKLQNSLDEYRQRLDLLITRHLSDEDLENFGLKPVSYLENREAINQALDRAGWPITEKDLQLLVDQIELGEKYLQQAVDVQQLSREASKNKQKRINPKNQQKKAIKQKVKKPPSPSKDETESSKTDESTSESDDDKKGKVTTSSSSSSSDNEQSVKSQPTTKRKKKTKSRRNQEPNSKGMKVIARDDDDGFYYEATIVNKKDNRHLVVEFEHAGKSVVCKRHVIPRSGAVPCPPLKVGDHTLCFHRNEMNVNCFVPAMVIGTPLKSQLRDKFYTLLKFDNTKRSLKRRQIIKIPSSDYEFALKYVNFAQQIDRSAPSVDFVRSDEKKSDLYKMVETNLVEVHKRFTELGGQLDSNVEQQIKHRIILEKLYQRLMKGSVQEFEQLREQLRQDRKELTDQLEQHQQKISSQVELATEANLKLLNRSDVTENTPTEITATEITATEITATEITATEAIATKAATSSRTSSRSSYSSRSEEKQDQDVNEKRSFAEKFSQTETQEDFSQSATEEEVGNESAKSIESYPSEKAETNEEDAKETEGDEEEKEDIEENGIQVGVEVIAQHTSFGFYYRGIVNSFDSNEDKYEISNSVGCTQITSRDKIITDSDDADHQLQVNDNVLGSHPYLKGYYAPAVIQSQDSQKLEILFFDGMSSLLPYEQVFMISNDKFREIVNMIEKCLIKWIDETVVARNDNDGVYQLAICKKLMANYNYELLWADGNCSVQELPLMFGALSDRRKSKSEDYILAMFDYHKLLYLPGKIVEDEENGGLFVHFCNDVKINWLAKDAKFSYLISEDFYKEASLYYKSRQKLLSLVKPS